MRLTKKPLEKAGEEIAKQLQTLGISPLAEIAEMLHGTIPLDDGDLEKPEYRLLLQDYEPFRAENGRLVLRIKSKIRAQLLTELLQYTAPKLRSSEVTAKVDNSIIIEIRNYSRDGKPGEVIDTQVIDQRGVPGKLLEMPDGTIKG